jgi:hypothetical protein
MEFWYWDEGTHGLITGEHGQHMYFSTALEIPFSTYDLETFRQTWCSTQAQHDVIYCIEHEQRGLGLYTTEMDLHIFTVSTNLVFSGLVH